MTTETISTAWTETQEARIAEIMQTNGGNRSNAVRKMRGEMLRKDVAKTLDKVVSARAETPAMAAATQAKLDRVNAKLTGKAKRTNVPKSERATERTSLTPQKMTAINAAVRDAIGKGRAVECTFKSSLSEKAASRYIWFGIDNSTVLSINPDSMETRWLDPASKSVKNWQRMQARAAKREDEAAAEK